MSLSLPVCPLDKLRPCFESEPSPPHPWEFTRCLSSAQTHAPAMFLFIQATGILGPNWVIIFPSSGPLELPSPPCFFSI